MPWRGSSCNNNTLSVRYILGSGRRRQQASKQGQLRPPRYGAMTTHARICTCVHIIIIIIEGLSLLQSIPPTTADKLAYMGWLCNNGEAHRRGRGEAQLAQIGRIVGAWWSATGWCSASKMSDRRGGAGGGGVARSLSHAHDITPMISRAASYLINRQHAAAFDSAISQFPAVPSTEPVCLPTYVCWSHPRPLTVLFRCCQREIKG